MITDTMIGIGCILGSLILVQSGMHIAVALMLLSFTGVSMILGMEVAGRMLSASAVSSISNYIFGVIPLFVLMGLLVSGTGLGRDLFDGATRLMARIRGGLGMATVAANAVFAACTGTSIASASVFTKVAVPEMERHGYTTRFSVGVVAGSSILGMLIPPSLLFIIFGVIANQSIGDLFLAGILPGVLMATAFCITILLLAVFLPRFVFQNGVRPEPPSRPTGSEDLPLWRSFLPLVPVSALVLVVLGGIYGGFFTPTEAGAVGALAALIIGVMRRELTLAKLWDIVLETGRVTAAVSFLLMAAQIYSQMLTLTGLPASFNTWIVEAELGFAGFLLIYIVVLIVLGMFLDSLSIMLIAVPFALDIMMGFGGSLIWFAVVTIIAVEIGLLTPPLGISCFVIKASLQRDNVTVNQIFAGAFPFLLTMLAVLLIVVLVPWLSVALI